MRVLHFFTFAALLAACGGAGDTQADSGSSQGALVGDAASRSAHAPDACLDYRDTVMLRGALSRETYPGPPNYQDIARGDEAETGLYLQLPVAVCTQHGVDETEATLESVVHVQLVLDSAQLAYLLPSVGDTVTLRGTMFSSHTGHHHAPLLLTVAP